MNIRFKTNTNPSLDEVESFLKELTEIDQKEFPFNVIRDVAEYLGCEYLKGKGRGSKESFRHELLEKYCPQYTNGMFGIHLLHKGKGMQLVRKRDYKYFIYRTLMQIIELRRQFN